MKRIIIYRSFLGTIKRYAELLREEIESDIDKYNKVEDSSLLKHSWNLSGDSMNATAPSIKSIMFSNNIIIDGDCSHLIGVMLSP